MSDLSAVDVQVSMPQAGRRTWRYAFLLALKHPFLRPLRDCFPAKLRAKLRERAEKAIYRQFRFKRHDEWMRARLCSQSAGETVPSRSETASPSAVPRLNLHGYFSRWLGLGECARLYAHALLGHGAAVSLHDVDIDIPHARLDQTLNAHFRHDYSSACDLVFVNPDHCADALLKIRTAVPGRRYVIGYWFWELESFPDAWLPALECVDEIMVSSAFVEQAIQRVSNKIVTRVPLPLTLGPDSGLQRHHFELKKDDYVFFCSFDFNSMIARKNPLAVVEAFRRAFPVGNEKVTLLIKSCNGDRDTAALMKLAEAVASDSRVMLRDDMLERVDLQALHRCADVHVSLHRAEGFGLGMAEAMCMGKPVIATAYSGNMEYMNADNSRLVDYRMIPIAPGQYHHGDGQRWADADVDHAARHMRALYLDRSLGQRIGANAARDMARHFSAEACMDVLMRRLEHIEGQSRSRAAG